MWIALGILAALALLLLAPIRLTCTISQGKGELVIRYLFFRFVFPKKGIPKDTARKKPEKKKKPKKTGKAAPEPPEPGKWDSSRIQDVIELAGAVLRAVGKAGHTFLRGLHIKTVALQMLVVRGDACQTAAASGKLNAVVYSAAAFVQNFVKIKKLMIHIVPCFWCREESVSFQGKVSVRPMRFLMAGAILLVNSAGPLLAFLRKQKEGARPEKAGASQEALKAD